MFNFVAMIKEIEIKTSPETAATPQLLKGEIARKLGIKISAISDWRIVRRAIDARRRPVTVVLGIIAATGGEKCPVEKTEPPVYHKVGPESPQVVIVGAGPAGLFAALRALELGMKPIVVERGKEVDERRVDVAEISRSGIVDPDSNYCFGEGGAGAFSDGKLFTRSKKRGNIREILSTLHLHGAKPDILVDAHPHIGSDRLPKIIKSMRETIREHGGEVRFGTRMESLILENGKVQGALLADGSRLEGPVILATGHSARDVYKMLHSKGVGLEAKGLAIGVRLEHPQHLIDCLQYHSESGRGQWLPAAEYRYVTQVDGRGVYSFCMCPGGVVVPSASGPVQNAVNGMSSSARNSHWANSGMVVEVHPEDFPDFAAEGEMAMLSLQESLEKRFYEAAGGTQKAPAQRMTDFVEGRDSKTVAPSSYAPGLIEARVDKLLPPQISDRLRGGFKEFGRRSRGFLTKDATVIGLESRTSSPVRIPRNPETLEHTDIENLYPAGEGAGYAGGIVSAAIDGRRCAEAVFAKYQKERNKDE